MMIYCKKTDSEMDKLVYHRPPSIDYYGHVRGFNGGVFSQE
jgi:hypothetical protein